MRQEVPILCGLAVLAALLSGCRQNANIQLLRRDLRLHEDHIYELEDAVAQYEDRLASCHRENAALKRRLAAADGSAAEPLPSPPPRVEPKRPRREPTREPPAELNGAGPPKIDLGTETTPDQVQPKSPSAVVPPDEPTPIPKEPSANSNPKRARGTIHPTNYADCPPVRAIAVNPRLTGGNDTDGKFGDEGVMLVLETKGDDGKLVDAPGDLSLTILDPAESGETARVAHWEFTSDEMAQHFRRLRFGQGYVFELPWPGEPPKHEQLTLRVRLATLDGRTLTTEHDFKAEILGHDEFVTRSVRAPRIRPWTPDRSGDSAIAPAAHDEVSLEGAENPTPRQRTTLPSSRSAPSSRPEWRPER